MHTSGRYIYDLFDVHVSHIKAVISLETYNVYLKVYDIYVYCIALLYSTK